MEARKSDEILQIEMRASPAGSVVRPVAYEAPMAGRSPDQLRSDMVRRYGAPGVSRPGGPVDMTWCTGGEQCGVRLATAEPSLSVGTDACNRLRITMYEGTDAERPWQTRLAAAAGGGAPARSSF